MCSWVVKRSLNQRSALPDTTHTVIASCSDDAMGDVDSTLALLCAAGDVAFWMMRVAIALSASTFCPLPSPPPACCAALCVGVPGMFLPFLVCFSRVYRTSRSSLVAAVSPRQLPASSGFQELRFPFAMSLVIVVVLCACGIALHRSLLTNLPFFVRVC